MQLLTGSRGSEAANSVRLQKAITNTGRLSNETITKCVSHTRSHALKHLNARHPFRQLVFDELADYAAHALQQGIHRFESLFETF